MNSEDQMLAYYERGEESVRLSGASLERLRTESILKRFLPRTPATVLDVGGADGVYAFPLALAGYRVHLVDPIPLHIQQAEQKSRLSGAALESIKTGDARKLEFPDSYADAVLYLGPLYHLTAESERLAALREAYRTLKPQGVFLAAFISKFASLLDGLRQHWLGREEFVAIVKQDLKDGQHHNPTNDPSYFTETHFHHPDEARREVEQAGFKNVRLLAVEGPLWLGSGVEEELARPKMAERFLEFLAQVETENTLLGASAHFMAVASK
jgi:ubiquinone/menaquinone biosynthesis C-methylase UbiE